MTTKLRRLHGLQFTAVMLLLAAAPLWGVLIAQMLWVEVPERCLYVVNPAAITIPIVAAIFWVGGHNSRRATGMNETLVENNGMLIRTVDRVTRPAVPARRAGTGPLTLV